MAQAQLDQYLKPDTLTSMEDSTTELEQDENGITLHIDPNLSLRFYAKNKTNRVDVRMQGKIIPLTEEQWKRFRELHVTIGVCFTLLRDGPSSIALE